MSGTKVRRAKVFGRLLMSGALLASLLTMGWETARPALAVDGCTSGSIRTTTQTGRQYGSNGYERGYEVLRSRDRNVYQFTVVDFLSDGTNDALCTWTAPKGIKRSQLSVVGGGGAGGSRSGGGGGGGGVYIHRINPIIGNTTYDITVGAGGLAKEASCESDCTGESGRASLISSGGVVTASAGGGGGGGGFGKSGLSVECSYSACGGGGGGAAGLLGSGQSTAGGIGAWGSEYFGGLNGAGPSYQTRGGDGHGGTAATNQQQGGGGGGGGATFASGYNNARSVGPGASGVFPLLTWGIDTYATQRTYGGGGGGTYMIANSFSGQFRAIGYCNLEFDEVTYSPTMSSRRASGGCAGSPGSPAQGGLQHFGGGGGGGSTASIENVWDTITEKAGNGGSGIVSIAYLQKPVVSGGSSSVSTAFGVTTSIPAFSATGGNNSEDASTTPNIPVTYQWSVKDASGSVVPGISINSSGVVTVGAMTDVGTYSMEVRATDYAGSYGTTPMTVTVSKGNQTPLSFTSTAPIDHHVGGNPYIVTAGGGSGSGALSLTIDSSSSNVCQLSGSTSGSEVSFQQVGDCVINANKSGDSSYLSATQAQQTVIVTPRSSQAVLSFTN